MLCPPREPGLCSPLSPPQPFPTAQPNFNKKPQPSALGGCSSSIGWSNSCRGPSLPERRALAQGGPTHFALPSSLVLYLGGQFQGKGDLWEKEGRMEPVGGKTRGRNLKNSSVKEFLALFYWSRIMGF